MLDDRELEKVSGLSLSVRAGEIVALAGVDGNGQQELVDAITGMRAPEAGTVAIDGIQIAGKGVRAATDAGVAHIAEDRQVGGWCSRSRSPRTWRCASTASPYSVPAAGFASVTGRTWRNGSSKSSMSGRRTGLAAASLSGGNQQKVCVAREIASNPKVLVAHQPTRGLDVGAIEFVHRRLIAERDKGRAVLLVSLEYEEVRALADRILVIYEGKIVGEFPPDASEEQLGIAMTGGTKQLAEMAVTLLEDELQAEAEESQGAAAASPAALTAFRRGLSGVMSRS